MGSLREVQNSSFKFRFIQRHIALLPSSSCSHGFLSVVCVAGRGSSCTVLLTTAFAMSVACLFSGIWITRSVKALDGWASCISQTQLKMYTSCKHWDTGIFCEKFALHWITDLMSMLRYVDNVFTRLYMKYEDLYLKMSQKQKLFNDCSLKIWPFAITCARETVWENCETLRWDLHVYRSHRKTAAGFLV